MTSSAAARLCQCVIEIIKRQFFSHRIQVGHIPKQFTAATRERSEQHALKMVNDNYVIERGRWRYDINWPMCCVLWFFLSRTFMDKHGIWKLMTHLFSSEVLWQNCRWANSAESHRNWNTTTLQLDIFIVAVNELLVLLFYFRAMPREATWSGSKSEVI